MKTTRRRFLAGVIGAIGLFLAGPAIRPVATRIELPAAIENHLDNLGRLYLVDRLEDETDDNLRSRILSARREHLDRVERENREQVSREWAEWGVRRRDST